MWHIITNVFCIFSVYCGLAAMLGLRRDLKLIKKVSAAADRDINTRSNTPFIWLLRYHALEAVPFWKRWLVAIFEPWRSFETLYSKPAPWDDDFLPKDNS